jgi:hypothetical protein
MIGTKHESEKWIHAFDLVDGTLKWFSEFATWNILNDGIEFGQFVISFFHPIRQVSSDWSRNLLYDNL